MNIKSALIRATVQLLAANTNIIQKRDPFSELLNNLMGCESEEERIAREMEAAVDKTVATVKRVTTTHKFKKIIKTSM